MSTSNLQPLILHAHPGPNPWKPALLLTSLSIPYTTILYTTPQLKTPTFHRLNRAGLAPVLEDPNTGLVLAESGAIQEYILERYDKGRLLGFGDGEDEVVRKWKVRQWMHFQNTSQGPGLQRIFRYSNIMPNPEARKDAVQAFKLVLDVLEYELSGAAESAAGGGAENEAGTGNSRPKDWLVGGKLTAADLVHLPFHTRLSSIMGPDTPDMPVEYPHVDAWIKRMLARAECQKIVAEMGEALARLVAGSAK